MKLGQLSAARIDTTVSATTKVVLLRKRTEIIDYREPIKYWSSPKNSTQQHRITAQTTVHSTLHTLSRYASASTYQSRRLQLLPKSGQPMKHTGLGINEWLAYIGSGLQVAAIIVGLIIGGSTGFTVGAIIFAVGTLLFGAGYGGVKK